MPFPKRLPPWPTFTPLERVFEAVSVVGLFEWDFAADRIVPCLGMSRLFGLDRATVTEGAPVRDFLSALSPEDRPLFSRRVGRVRQDVERLAYRVERPGGAATSILEYTYYEMDGHGMPFWACGALFDRSAAAGARSITSGHTRSEVVDRAAALATELRVTADDLGSPILKALLDVVLYEIGKALVEDIRRPGGKRLN